MANVSAAKREAIKALLRAMMKASLAATRAVEPYMTGGAEDKPARMNAICAELLMYHMWAACKRARKKMLPDAFKAFRDHAARGLAITAAGCFTGLLGTKTEEYFLVKLRDRFVTYDRSDAAVIVGTDPLTSNDPVAVVSRAIAQIAIRGGTIDAMLTIKVMVAVMESVNASQVNDCVDAAARAA